VPRPIHYLTAAPTYLATYGFNPVSLRAPVRVLFPYGFGLSYDR